MRLLKTGLLGHMLVIVLACSCTSTGNKTHVGVEGGPCTSGDACDPGLVCLARACAKQADAGAGGGEGSLAAGSSNQDGSSTYGAPAHVKLTAASAQWIQTNWPTSNSYFNLYTSPGWVFARIWDSVNGGRVLLTADDGANWAQSVPRTLISTFHPSCY